MEIKCSWLWEMLPLIWKPTWDKLGQPKFGGETTKQKPFREWCWSCCNNLRHGITNLRPLSFVKRCNYIHRIKINYVSYWSIISLHVCCLNMFCILYWCPTNTSTKKNLPNKVTVADVQAARGGTLGKCSDGTAPTKVWRWSHGTEMYGYLTVGFCTIWRFNFLDPWRIHRAFFVDR